LRGAGAAKDTPGGNGKIRGKGFFLKLSRRYARGTERTNRNSKKVNQ